MDIMLSLQHNLTLPLHYFTSYDRSNYFLTEKSDGTRYLLYVIDTSRYNEFDLFHLYYHFVVVSVFFITFFMLWIVGLHYAV